jgi:colanic acid biosynthesis glycosyl transferase WcaI
LKANDGHTSDIAIVTAWYPPEAAPFGQMMHELAHFLVDNGLRIDVITSVPNHPEGVLPENWKNKLLQVERPRPGLRILRVGALLRPRSHRGQPRGRLQRMAAYLTFTVLVLLLASWKVKPRVIFGVMQPLTIAPVLHTLARLRRAKLVFNIQDLHPDAAVSLRLLRNSLLIRLLRRMESRAYRNADALSVICEGFRDHCVARGATADAVRVIPNWIDLDEVRPLGAASVIRAELGLDERAFVVLYAGTIGYVSGAEVVIDAADRLQGLDDLHFVFIGEGPLVGELQRQRNERRLKRVHFLPFQPRERLSEVQGTGDVSVVTLLPGHGRTSVPSKVLGYMAAARPIVAAVDADSETARFIEAARAGLVTPAGDAVGLATAIQRLHGQRALARDLGLHGRRFLEAEQSKEHVLARYLELFRQQVSP